MASRIDLVSPTKREVVIDDELTLIITISADGITATRKGDKHRENTRRILYLGWAALPGVMEPLPPPADLDDYTPHGFLNYVDEG